MNARQYLLLALPVAFLGGSLLAQTSGCVEKDPNHCINNSGDAYCAEKHPDWDTAFCSLNCGDYEPDGCVQEQPANECWACNGNGDNENCGATGEDTGTDTTTDPTDTADTTTVSTETTAETTTEGPECQNSDECSLSTPLCEGGTCVSCGDATTVSCADANADAPACDEASGECMQCTDDEQGQCNGTTPVCEDFTCVMCTEHEQCPASACNMQTGACMSENSVWWVDQTIPVTGDGTMASPFKSLAEATTLIGMDGEGVIYLMTPNDHQEQLVVLPTRTVALIGKSEMGGLRNNQSAAISIEGTAFVDNIRINGGAAGVDCGQGQFWLTNSSITTNGRGLNVDGCAGIVRRSRIVNNLLSGVRMVDGTLDIENSFVGGDVSDQVALDIISPTATVDIVYSTLVAGFGNAAAIRCSNAGAGSSVRNSILVARTNTDEVLQCADLQLTNNALEASIPNNVGLGAMNTTWFSVLFGSGDFSLSDMAPPGIASAAIWQTGDPETDIHGDPRPTTDGSTDYAGADVPN